MNEETVVLCCVAFGAIGTLGCDDIWILRATAVLWSICALVEAHNRVQWMKLYRDAVGVVKPVK